MVKVADFPPASFVMKSLLVLTLAGLIGCSAIAVTANEATYLVYVSNEISGDVSVIDGQTLSVASSVPVGKRPRGIHVSPDGGQILVAVSGSPRMGPGADPERAKDAKADKSADGIVVIDAATGCAMKKLSVGSDPEEFALDHRGNRVFVSNEDTAELSAWEIGTGKLLWATKVSEEPEGVSVHPTRAEVFVSCEGGGDIYIVDTERGELRAQIEVGERPRSIAFAPDGNRAYISLEGESAIAVVDAVAHRLLSKIKLPESALLPMAVRLAPSGQQAYISTGRGGKLAIVDLDRGKTELLPAGKRPWGLALSPDGKRLFAANGPSNDVTVIDVESRKEIARIKVGQGPWGVAIGRAPASRLP